MDQSYILTSGLRDGLLTVSDMRSHKPILTEKAHGGAINYLHLTSEGLIITGSSDSSIRLFDLRNG